jgi:hypothetical protein
VPLSQARRRCPLVGGTDGEAGPGAAARIRRGMGDWRVGLAAVVLLACAACQPAAPAAAPTFTVLQLNLCDSGQAACYAGGAAVPEAAGVIRDTRPDVVTLNEICRRDLAALAPSMPGTAYTAFQSVYDPAGGGPYHCVNGDDFGIGVIARVEPGATPGVRGGRHPIQIARPDELRSWACVALPGRQVCVTHLVDGHPDTALAQCRWLLDRVAAPAVVAGDLNLTERGVAGCVPAGWSSRGDGGVQWVLASPDAVPSGTRRIPLRHTDHSGLLVTLRLP